MGKVEERRGGAALVTSHDTMRWSDIQQLIELPCGYTFTGNFGNATSKGIDAEFEYNPLSGLRLALALAYNEAQITASVSGAQAQAGQQIEYAPRWQAAASADYEWALRPDVWASARVSWNTTSGQQTGYDTASPFYNMGGFSLTNVNFGVKRHAWQATMFVSNLFNKRAQVDLYNAYGVNAPDTQPLGINRPRTFGLELRFAQ
jgi:outer membrane receptor protein involved in Fe transport